MRQDEVLTWDGDTFKLFASTVTGTGEQSGNQRERELHLLSIRFIPCPLSQEVCSYILRDRQKSR